MCCTSGFALSFLVLVLANVLAMNLRKQKEGKLGNEPVMLGAIYKQLIFPLVIAVALYMLYKINVQWVAFPQRRRFIKIIYS